jgi:hypothetical protein
MKQLPVSVFLTLSLSPVLALAVSPWSTEAQQDPTTELSKHWGEDSIPNVRLNLKEGDRKNGGGFTKVMYHLENSGFPAGKSYTVWMKQSGDQKIIPFISGYSADASGKLVCPPEPQPNAPNSSDLAIPCAKLSMPLDQFPFGIGHYHKGEPFDLAVVSTDGAVRAFARAYPFPIQAHDAKCSLTVELRAADGNYFLIQGAGFESGEDVKIVSTSGKEVIGDSQKVSPQGEFSTTVLPAVKGKDSGSFNFTATGASCRPSVTFEWGRAAMKIQ